MRLKQLPGWGLRSHEVFYFHKIVVIIEHVKCDLYMEQRLLCMYNVNHILQPNDGSSLRLTHESSKGTCQQAKSGNIQPGKRVAELLQASLATLMTPPHQQVPLLLSVGDGCNAGQLCSNAVA